VNTLEAARRFFGDVTAASGEASDPRIADAFASIPREDFLGPGPWLTIAGNGYVRTPTADPVLLYQDRVFALLPDKRLNNGEPSLHARCIAAAAPQPGEQVLQVGAGGGYYTAILATLVEPDGSVEAREVEPGLIASGDVQSCSLQECHGGRTVGHRAALAGLRRDLCLRRRDRTDAGLA